MSDHARLNRVKVPFARSHRGRTSKRQRSRRALLIERLESRRLLAAVPGWAETLGGADVGDARASIEVDADENIYVFTLFKGTVDFDFGPGVFEMTDVGGNYGDGAIAKYTRDRELVWAKSFGGVGSERIKDIEVDAAGNVYVTGRSNSATINFDAIALTTNGGDDAYVAKLDANGNFLWAKSFGGATQDYGSDLAINAAGDVFVAGMLEGQADFDPDPVDEFILTSAGGRDGIVWKLNSSGDFQWVRHFAGPGASDQVFSLEVDASNNLYMTGQFTDTINFGTTADPILRTSAGVYDAFVLKLDSAGDTVWVTEISGTGGILSTAGIALSDNDSVYVGGNYEGTATFGPGGPTLIEAADRDSFISKWDANGALIWAKSLTGTEIVRRTAAGIMTDNNDNVYMVGAFKGTVDFDPDAIATFPLTASPGFLDGYLVQLDGAGDFVAAYHATGPDFVRTEEVAISTDGDIYAIGSYLGTATLPTGEVVTSGTYRDTFIEKIARAPGVSVSPTVGLVTSESGAQATFNVVLDIAPTADVIVDLSSSDLSEGTVAPASLTFTPSDWNVPQSVTVTGVDDVSVDGDIGYSVALGGAVSTDPGYNGFDPSDVTVTNTDDDQPIVLFADSFENGQWNGLWVEDSQNDWFTSTQRSTDGSSSAEVDGNASDATLSLANAIDMTPYGVVDLTFSWLIENGFDTNEYLAVDLFDGTSWNEVARLLGNVDQENVWHHETINIGASYLVSDFNMRFRATANRSNEDANVDNVQLIATSLAGPPNQAPSITSTAVVTATEDLPYSYDVDAVDPDAGDTLTYSLDTAPTGMTIDAVTGVIGWTPNNALVGSNSVTVRAEDGGGLSDTQNFNVVVANVNDAPIITSSAVTTANAESPYSYDVDASDPDTGDTQLYSLDVAPVGMTIDSASGLIQWTPTSSDIGNPNDVTVRVADMAGDFDTQSFSVSVSPPSTDEIYVYDIRFASKKANRDWRATFEVRDDDNNPIAGVAITVTFAGIEYVGTTNSNGTYTTPWIKNLGSGSHFAEVTDLVLANYDWNQDLGQLGDDDDDGFPDAWS